MCWSTQESDFAEEKKLLKFLRNLPVETKELTPDASKSGSALDRHKTEKKTQGKKVWEVGC
jgi:hypothetical protein